MRPRGLLLLFIWTVLSCFCILHPGAAQGISGQLIDIETKQALAWATVSIWKIEDQQLLSGTMSDEHGYFSLPLPQLDSFEIEIQMLGYELYRRVTSNTSGFKEYSLGKIYLSPQINELGEVTVTAKKKTLISLAGGYQINNTAQLSLVNPDAKALLRQAPGISIHAVRGIEVMGKSNIVVKVDGKPIPISGRELVAFLAEIAAEEIKYIRIITTPSASEQAGQGGGVIEITTNRKDKRGTFAQASTELGSQQKIRAGVAAIFNTERLSIYGRLSMRDQRFIVQEEDYYTDYSANSPGQFYDYKSRHVEHLDTWGGQWSLDYNLGKNTTAGVIIRYNEYQQDNNSLENQTEYFDQNGNLLQTSRWQAGSAFQNQRQYYNLSFRSDLGQEGQSLKSDYALTLHSRYNGIHLTPLSPLPTDHDATAIHNLANYDVQIHRAQMDYQRAVNEQWTAETGVRFDRVLVDNRFNTLQQIGGTDTQVNDLYYEENILGFYANIKGETGKLSVEAGIRAEGTELELTANQEAEQSQMKRSRWDLFPSLMLKYPLQEAHSISWTLSKRIDRPPYYVLNPYNYNPNPNILDQGNPSLSPALDYRGELSYAATWNESFSSLLSGGYSYIQDFYAYITQENKDGQYINYPVNISNAQESYVSLYASYELTDWWSLNANFLMSRMDFNGENFGVTPPKAISSYSLSLGQQFDLGSDFSGQIQAEYTSAQTTLYGQGNGYQSIDVSLGKTFFGQLKCQIEITDLFNRDENRWIFRSAGLNYHGRWKYESRIASLRLKWSFGRYVKSKAKRHQVSQDERYEGK